ncbi:flavin reductase family protein [Phenylobacterium immobile]|uniref:flavin reductase family protein n=1 Tax=Phenylobacterium immobile TaxID=21 RepID=UPI000ADA568A|nr:flavin reductase family protein [Phenylobacterium immobile]
MVRIQPELFRDALSGLPAGVTVITSVDSAGVFVGATVSAFMSLSLDPPLVLASVAASARTALAAQSSGAYAAHIVGAKHQDLAMRFASSNPDKFEGLRYHLSARGVPVLEDFDISLECSLYAEHPGGDHTILVGLVEAVNMVERGPPAVWYDRSFHNLKR